MRSLAIFNHTGGSAKTARREYFSRAWQFRYTCLIIDLILSGNISSFFLAENVLDGILGESGETTVGKPFGLPLSHRPKAPATSKNIPPFFVSGKKSTLFFFFWRCSVVVFEEELPSALVPEFPFARKSLGYAVAGGDTSWR